MNVKELKEFLDDFDDETSVDVIVVRRLRGGDEHSIETAFTGTLNVDYEWYDGNLTLGVKD